MYNKKLDGFSGSNGFLKISLHLDVVRGDRCQVFFLNCFLKAMENRSREKTLSNNYRMSREL